MELFSHIFPRLRGLNTLSVLADFTDYHSHILPGVDDGIQTTDDALRLLDEYEQRGCKKLWLTPHIMEDFPNETSKLRERFKEFKSVYRGNILLNLAAENMIDDLFESRLQHNDLLPIRGKFLLVETSYFDAPINFVELLEEIFRKGYTPILAHPERYNYMNEDMYKKLKDINILFQLNMMSLASFYGEHVKVKAQNLLAMGMYDFVGTDIHSLSQLKVIDELSGYRKARLHLSQFD